MQGLLEWGQTLVAGFVAAGSAVVALRFLSETALGHWLAKGLVKYTAQVETTETRKRIAIERRDRQCADAIAGIMAGVGEFALYVAYPPNVNHDDAVTPEIVFQNRYREMTDLVQSVSLRAMKAAHLFEDNSPLILACLEWGKQAHDVAGSYYDALGACVNKEHWDLPRSQRLQRLIQAHQTMHSADFPATRALLAECRMLSSEPQ